jgi:nucleoside-diphosphate-sugar epimerase
MSKKTALVLGAGGFIGSHMVKRLKSEGYWVRGVDLKHPDFSETEADEFLTGDLAEADFMKRVIAFRGEQGNFYASVPFQYETPFDEIYQFAADMGGAGFIFTGENDAEIMHNSVSININLLREQLKMNASYPRLLVPVPDNVGKTKIFCSSSACMYPEYNQLDPDNPDCREESAYPAAPDSEYGWEKLFSERLHLTYSRNYGMPVLFLYRLAMFPLDQKYCGNEQRKQAYHSYDCT